MTRLLAGLHSPEAATGMGLTKSAAERPNCFLGVTPKVGVTLNPLAGVGLNPLKDLDLTEG